MDGFENQNNQDSVGATISEGVEAAGGIATGIATQNYVSVAAHAVKGGSALLKIVLGIVLAIPILIIAVFASSVMVISGIFGFFTGDGDTQSVYSSLREDVVEVLKNVNIEVDKSMKTRVYEFMPDFYLGLRKAVVGEAYAGENPLLFELGNEQDKAVSSEYSVASDAYLDGQGQLVQEHTLSAMYETSNGHEQKSVEYITVGNVNLYIPRLMAMYYTYKHKQTQTLADEDPEDFEEQMQIVVDEQFDSENNLLPQNFSESNMQEMETLLLGVYGGDVGLYEVDIQNRGTPVSTLSITLTSARDEELGEVFHVVEEEDWRIVDEIQVMLEQKLKEAGYSEEELYIAMDELSAMSLFTAFEGFFELPVEIDKIKNISAEFGQDDSSGLTLEMEESVPVKLNFMPSVQYVRAITIASVQNDVDGNSAITLAYEINTRRFEEVHGFPFPQLYHLDGSMLQADTSGSITMLVECAGLDNLKFDPEDVGENYLDLTDDDMLGHANEITLRIAFIDGVLSLMKYDEYEQYKYQGLALSDNADEYADAIRSNPRIWYSLF